MVVADPPAAPVVAPGVKRRMLRRVRKMLRQMSRYRVMRQGSVGSERIRGFIIITHFETKAKSWLRPLPSAVGAPGVHQIVL